MKTNLNSDAESPGQSATGGAKKVEFLSTQSETSREDAPVFELRKILVPVDFSSCSRKALQYAIPFARRFGAELILLHVIEPFVSLAMPEGITEGLVESVEDVQRRLEKFRKTVASDIKSKAVVRGGSPHMEIVDAAKEFEIDLVILSTHGRSGFGHVLLGSTVERVVRRISCPVLVVREHEHEFIHVGNCNSVKEIVA